MELDHASVFTPRAIQRYGAHIATTTQRAQASTAKSTSRLTTIGRRLNPNAAWPDWLNTTTHRQLKEPYTDAEVRFLLSALANNTTSENAQVALVFHIILGAGLTPNEYRHLRAGDIDTVGTFTTVTVPTGHGRVVPLAEPHASRLGVLLPDDPQDYLLARRGENGLSHTLQARPLGAQRVVLSTGRLRTTWMLHRLRAGATPATVAAAAGLKTYGFLTSLAAHFPAQTDDEVHRALTMRVTR